MTNQEWLSKLAWASVELTRAVQSGGDPLELEDKVTHVSCMLEILLEDVEGALSYGS